MNPENIKILNQLTAVNLSVSIWTARKKLNPEDFGGVDLPPEELASLGSKKICDPDDLKIFTTLKARAVSHLDKTGVRFMGGWAIPDDQIDFVYDRLMEVKNEFMIAKDEFIGSYDQAVKNWVDKHPGWERLIEASPVSVDQVRGRFSFKWQFYKVMPPENSLVADSLLSEVSGLGNTLFSEIAKDATEIWNKVYAGKIEVSHKALSPLKAMWKKLNGLSFVEPSVAPVCDIIEAAMSTVPKRGMISGNHLLILQGVVSMLREPNLLLSQGQNLLNSGEPLDVLSTISKNFSLGVNMVLNPHDHNSLSAASQDDDLYEQDDLVELESMDNDTEQPVSDQNEKTDGQTPRQVPFLNSLDLW
jgi:hypothetical protein